MNKFPINVFNMNEYKIDNLNNMKSTVAKLTEDIKEKHLLSEEKYFDIRLVLSELIMNAFKHSRKDSFVDIMLDRDFADDSIKITVEDYGQGFDMHHVKRAVKGHDIYNNNGRGIKLVDALCETVTYNDLGNSVSIVIKV